MDQQKVLSDEKKTGTNITNTSMEAEINKITESLNKIQISLNTTKQDVEKLKIQHMDKVSKGVFVELENRVNTHSKGLESISRKVNELNTSFKAFSEQPISFAVIEGIQKHVEETMLREVKILIDSYTNELRRLIDEKNAETRQMVQNTKKFMYR